MSSQRGSDSKKITFEFILIFARILEIENSEYIKMSTGLFGVKSMNKEVSLAIYLKIMFVLITIYCL